MATPQYAASDSKEVTSAVHTSGSMGRTGIMGGSSDCPLVVLRAGAPPTFCSENTFLLVYHLHHTNDSDEERMERRETHPSSHLSTLPVTFTA